MLQSVRVYSRCLIECLDEKVRVEEITVEKREELQMETINGLEDEDGTFFFIKK